MNFVRPNYLDSLSSFKRIYQDPILAGKEEGASREAIRLHDAALNALQSKLSAIMLQRSHSSMVKSTLPEKITYLIACSMTHCQREAYNTEADRVLRSCDHATSPLSSVSDDEDDCPQSSSILSGLQKLRLISNFPKCSCDSCAESLLSSSMKFKVWLPKILR